MSVCRGASHLNTPFRKLSNNPAEKACACDTDILKLMLSSAAICTERCIRAHSNSSMCYTCSTLRWRRARKGKENKLKSKERILGLLKLNGNINDSRGLRFLGMRCVLMKLCCFELSCRAAAAFSKGRSLQGLDKSMGLVMG